MYSGITKGVFPVVFVERRAGVLRFDVELSAALTRGLERGASVSVDGACLSVVDIEGPRVGFEAIAETQSLTTLGTLHEGRLVSIERSCRIGDELGGHDVFGHVVGTGEIVERGQLGEQLDLTVGVPAAWTKYLFYKGFVALDGSSLTLGRVTAGRFDVHLIPETLRVTNFARKAVGDRVNVELDARTVAIVDSVERVLRERGF